MIASVLTLAASPVFGSLLKILAGSVASFFEGREKAKDRDHERDMERSEEGRKVLQQRVTMGSSKPEHVSYAMGTRRHIALVLTYTIAVVTILWALYPDVEIVTLNRNPGTKTYLWGLFSTTVAKPITIIISSGDVVFGVLHLVGTIVGIYATPDRTGK